MLKEAKLWVKLFIGFGVTILVMLMIAVLNHVFLGQVDHLSHEVEQFNQHEINVQQKIIDHLNWVNKVMEFFTDERVTELKVETDDTKCGLGKWLAGEDVHYLSRQFPQLKELFGEIKGPHHRLHVAASQIKELYQHEAMVRAQNKQTETFEEVNRIAGSFHQTLRDLMEKHIDPMKTQAEEAKDVEAVIRCGRIDMHLNEEIIQPISQFLTAVERLNRIQSEDQWMVCKNQLETVRQRISVWREIVRDQPELAQTADGFLQLADQVGAAVETLYQAIVAFQDADASQKSATMILQEEAMPAARETIALLSQIRGFLQKKADETGESIQEHIDRNIWWTTLISVLGILLALVAAVIISIHIVRPIKRVISFAGRLKVGDLSAKLSEGRDEAGLMAAALNSVVDHLKEKTDVAEQIAGGNLSLSVSMASDKDQLSKALEAMIVNLNLMIDDLKSAVDQVDAGARQVSDSSQSLSQGATQQAASLEEITSSMNEIGDQTKSSAENATQANRLAADALSATADGVDQMERMVEAMDAIRASSSEIAKIIKTIDAISFQTNLLALNAAVEAARAGKHGKGFAVVAQEVRALATRSALAAQETAELIAGAEKKVETGSSIAVKTSQALSQIKERITKVSELIAEIAAASNEQAQGIFQINQGLGQIDGVTQQNTANAEETSSASEELSSQAAQVRELLRRFHLRESNREELRHEVALSLPEAAANVKRLPIAT
ncbi:MAG: methyl-accepting chemotaxis protein [Thermodesulfobacteriota bacterium]